MTRRRGGGKRSARRLQRELDAAVMRRLQLNAEEGQR